MLKNIFIATLLAACVLTCNAQTDSVIPKKFNHYVGMQVNQLLKEIITFNSNNIINDNPYVLTYAISAAKTGWELHTGLGFNYKKVTDKDVAGKITETNDLSLRFGIGRKVMIGRKVEAGYGFDLITNSNTDKTSGSLITTFDTFADSTATIVTNKITGQGAGVQFNFAFRITERILIGTEASGYFIKSKNKQEVSVFTLETNLLNNTNTEKTEVTTKETDTSSFTLSLPIAIFLIIKF